MTRTTPRKARSKPARRSHGFISWAIDQAALLEVTLETKTAQAVWRFRIKSAEAQLAALLEDSRRRP